MTVLLDDAAPGVEGPRSEGALRRRPAASRPLARYLLRRFCWGLVLIWVVTVLVFVATQALPGDAAAVILGDTATPERLAQVRATMHLDDPMIVQYVKWLGGLLHGDLGVSLGNRQPVSAYIGSRLRNTLVLSGLSCLIAVPISFGLGLRAATRPGGLLDRAVSGATVVLSAVPSMVFGIVLIYLFATNVWQWLPAVSLLDTRRGLFGQLDKLVLPALTLALTAVPPITYNVRASMLEVLRGPYIGMARLNGLRERTVLWREALPNALGPVGQATALMIVIVVGGTTVIETIFGYDGVGLALAHAVNGRDVPLLQGITVVLTAATVAVVLCFDMLAVLLNPRLRTAL
ncbi:ABC transporter permease [Nocardia aurantia]|uniref:Nickel transport system permease protein NikB n=1 Tax=Nocardia aurantia TaxID=2585199 RepID=A0A7K0DK08_9NOCA|nr:ABC transporter permease [Nocardia aurantia]MQY26140.1 Nickel transport system permease protein NikB [Nocardia aurantia]